MNAAWLSSAEVLVVAGKGGVGSSTVAAAAALAVAREGLDVLLISVDGRPGLGPLLGGQPLDENDQLLRKIGRKGRIRGRTIPPKQAFADYLDLKGIGGVLRKTASAASLDTIAAATPGLEHLLVLGKIKELVREKSADLIVVDAPPAGHAAAFLRSAAALQEVVASGPIRTQADEVAAMLADPSQCQATLVTLPEETPVNEVIELAYDIEHVVGIALTPLVVNCYREQRAGLTVSARTAARDAGVKLTASQLRALDASSSFGKARQELSATQLRRLADALPLSLVTLPRCNTARLGSSDLSELADALCREPLDFRSVTR